MSNLISTGLVSVVSRSRQSQQMTQGFKILCVWLKAMATTDYICRLILQTLLGRNFIHFGRYNYVPRKIIVYLKACILTVKACSY